MKKIVLWGLLLMLGSCTPRVIVDYLTVAVPEEGSLKLTQYTREDDNLSYPYIAVNEETKKLVWYAPPLIAVSPNGEKVAYIGSSNDFNNLYLKNIKGGKSTIQRTHNRDVMDMSYSPDGKYIAFTSRRKGGDDIYMINATEGVAVQELVSTNESELSPSFSHDGNNVFFAKSLDDRFYIWSLNVETSLVTQYTEGFTPDLAPNGEDLVVTRNSKDGFRGEIWMININSGTETQILTDPEKGFSSPRISPDGEWIICVGITVGDDKTKPDNLDLYLVKKDGTKLTQITFHGGHDVSPVWTPDGKSIFFISQRGNKEGKYNLWKMGLENIIQ